MGCLGSGRLARMATMADLDELALALPETTQEVSEDGRPAYAAQGKIFAFHRSQRRTRSTPTRASGMATCSCSASPDLDVKELLLSDDRGIYFTTPHFDGYPAVLVRIPDLERLDRDELGDLLADAWLTRAKKSVAKAWLAEHGVDG